MIAARIFARAPATGPLLHFLRKRSAMSNQQVLGLKAGEWVQVRSKEEILATLDANGRLDEMPFMPEMLKFCGARMIDRKSVV